MADSSDDERRRTETLSFSEAASIDVSQIAKVAAVSVDLRVLGLSLVYFGAVATNYGLSFFLPQIVKAFGFNAFLTTLVSAAPYAVGLIAMVWWGRRSDRLVERRFHAAFPLFVAAAGIAVINSIGNLAGFAGPFAMGWIKDHTGSYAGGLLLLAGLALSPWEPY